MIDLSLFLDEMQLPSRKLHRRAASELDTVMLRKMHRQQSVEDRFMLRFTDIIEKYQGDRGMDKFISRYYKYIEGFNYPGDMNPDISMSQVFNFINFLGRASEYDKIARIMGIVKSHNQKMSKKDEERIHALKDELWELLASIKRIFRGTSSDKTHAGVSHPPDVQKRYNAARLKHIQSKWHARKLSKQLRDMDQYT